MGVGPSTNPFRSASGVRARPGAGAVSSSRSTRRRLAWGGTAVALLLLGGAWTVAASLSVAPGATEVGGGAFHSTQDLTYFAEADAGVTTVSNPSVAVLSPAVATPTVLAGASASYGVNALTMSDPAQFWVFTESTAAPVNTEVELQFWVSTGAGPTVAHLALYVETQATAPGSPLTFTLFYDLGNPGSGSIALDSVFELSQACPSVGSCF